MSEYRDKQIIIVGAGKTGHSLAWFFCEKGGRITLSDARSVNAIEGLDELKELPVSFDLGGHTDALFLTADLIVISPGVPLNIPALEKARAQGVPIVGEIEIAWRELLSPLIGVTGTNGKSTVTTLIGAIMKEWGRRTFVGGNLGTPLITAVNNHWDWLVVELSSFQLESIESFRPKYGVLLNISQDHLDRYPNMTAYVDAKKRLFANMTSEDIAVLNADDPEVTALQKQIKARQVWFSASRILNEGMSLRGDQIVWRWQGEELCFPTKELKVCGLHNLENVMAALIPALLEGCPPATAWAAATFFQGLPHRMELIGERRGVRWIDDSKGTNIGSVVKSLAGLSAPVTLIAGGKDKFGDLMPLTEPLGKKVRHLILLGEAAERMEGAFQGVTEIHRVENMSAAVNLADKLTDASGTVLLSPGCSSFDMFRSYEERGQTFVKAFRSLGSSKEN